MLDPPVPILATWVAFPPKVVVTFNHLLVPAALDPGTWTIRHADQNFVVQAAAALTNEVTLTHAPGLADLGPDVVNYTPPPYDVISLGGLVPAGAFLNFPLV